MRVTTRRTFPGSHLTLPARRELVACYRMMEIVHGERAPSPLKIREINFQIPACEWRPSLCVRTAIRREAVATIENCASLAKCQEWIVCHVIRLKDLVYQ